LWERVRLKIPPEAGVRGKRIKSPSLSPSLQGREILERIPMDAKIKYEI
jgi:hypothetical protein